MFRGKTRLQTDESAIPAALRVCFEPVQELLLSELRPRQLHIRSARRRHSAQGGTEPKKMHCSLKATMKYLRPLPKNSNYYYPKPFFVHGAKGAVPCPSAARSPRIDGYY